MNEFLSNDPLLWGVEATEPIPAVQDPVVENAVKAAMEGTEPRRSPRFINWLIAAIVLVLVAIVVGGIWTFHSLKDKSALQGHQLTLAQQALAHESAERAQAEGALGQTVQQLQSAGIQPSISSSSVPPEPGPAGRGILAVTRNASDHLIIVFTDGVTDDLGSFTGSPGSNGRGINNVSVTSGDLIVSFSDGSSADVGHVVGAPGLNGATGADGRGVSSAGISGDGHLVLTYTDGSSQDVGNVVGPVGSPGGNGANGTNGTDGAAGQPPVSWTYTTTDILGNTTPHTCVRDVPFDVNNPTYHCT